MPTDAEKGRAWSEEQRARFEFLDRRIRELHKEGVLGRTARLQADAEWAKEKRDRDG